MVSPVGMVGSPQQEYTEEELEKLRTDGFLPPSTVDRGDYLFHLDPYDSGEYVTDGDRVLRHVPVKISCTAKILKIIVIDGSLGECCFNFLLEGTGMSMSVEELRNVLRTSPYYGIAKENVETLDEKLLGKFFLVVLV